MKQKDFTYYGGYSSNSRIFQNRGDPWMTELEGIRQYDREMEELPDLDAYWKARRALEKMPDKICKAAPKVEKTLSRREIVLQRHQARMTDIGNRLHKGAKQKGGF